MDESQFVVGLPIRSSIKTAKDTTIPYISPPTQDPDLATVMPNQAVTVSVNVTDKGSGLGDVILSYRTHSGLNGLPPWALWTDVSMSKGLGDRYVAEIAGVPAGATVEYKIIAFDTEGNMAVEDNAGQYYVYVVTQEAPFWMQWWFVLIVGIVIVTLGGIILFLKPR
jgi:hypothetical protein